MKPMRRLRKLMARTANVTRMWLDRFRSADALVLANRMMTVAHRDKYGTVHRDRPVAFLFGADREAGAWAPRLLQGYRTVTVRANRRRRYTIASLRAVTRTPGRICICFSLESCAALAGLHGAGVPVFLAARSSLAAFGDQGTESLRLIALGGRLPETWAADSLDIRPGGLTPMRLLQRRLQRKPPPAKGEQILVIADPGASCEFAAADVHQLVSAELRKAFPQARIERLENPLRFAAVPGTGTGRNLAWLAENAASVSTAYILDPTLNAIFKLLKIPVVTLAIKSLLLPPAVVAGADDDPLQSEDRALFIDRARRSRLAASEAVGLWRTENQAFSWDNEATAGRLDKIHASALEALEKQSANQPDPAAAVAALHAAMANLDKSDRISSAQLAARLYHIAHRLERHVDMVLLLDLVHPDDAKPREIAEQLASIALEEEFEVPRRAVLAAVAEHFKSRPDVIEALTEYLVSRELPQAALSLARLAAVQGIRSAKLFRLISTLSQHAGQHQAAVDAARQAFQLSPSDLASMDELSSFTGGMEGIQGGAAGLAQLLSQARDAQLSGNFAAAEAALDQAAAAASPKQSDLIAEQSAEFALATGRSQIAIKSLSGSVTRAAGKVRDRLAVQYSQALFEGGDPSRAFDVLRQARQNGSTAASRRLKGLALRAGTVPAEISELRTLIGAGVQPGLLMPDLFDLLIVAGRREEAFSALRGAMSARAASRNALACHAARYYLAQTDLPAARQELAAANQSDTQVLRLMAGISEASGAAPLAGRLLVRALSLDPQNRGLLHDLAMFHAKARRHAEALPYFEQLMATAGGRPHLYAGWARGLRLTGRLAATRDSLERAFRAGGLESRYAVRLAFLHAEAGEMERAAHFAMEGLRLEPAQFALARTAVQQNLLLADHDAAAAAADMFETAGGRTALHLAQAAELWRHIENFDRAIDRAQKSAAIGSFSAAALELSARVLAEAGRNEEAHAVARRAVEADPGVEGPFIMASLTARTLELQEEALRHATIATQLRFDSPRALANLAKVQEEAGAFSSAHAAYELSELLRKSRFEPPNIRNASSMFNLAGHLRDWQKVQQGVEIAVTGMAVTMPDNWPRWSGEPLAGKRICIAVRGGPGDELRFYNTMLSSIYQEAAELVLIGDGRLQTIFERNFPKARFVANVWAGRRTKRVNDRIDPDHANRLEPGTAEILARFSIGIPKGTLAGVDYFCFSDDVSLRRYYDHIGVSHRSRHQTTLTARPELRRAIRAKLDALGPNPKVGINWRGAYFSLTRLPVAFLNVTELRSILETPGITFINLQVATSDEEDAILATYETHLVRLEDLDFRDDFESMAALALELDATIATGTTQRDTAGAFGAANLWSFSVVPGVGEFWRVLEGSQEDCWQQAISHHNLHMFGSRGGVIAALISRIKALKAKRRRSPHLKPPAPVKKTAKSGMRRRAAAE